MAQQPALLRLILEAVFCVVPLLLPMDPSAGSRADSLVRLMRLVLCCFLHQPGFNQPHPSPSCGKRGNVLRGNLRIPVTSAKLKLCFYLEWLFLTSAGCWCGDGEMRGRFKGLISNASWTFEFLQR